VPKAGESVVSTGLRYTVEEVEERRVALVRVEPETAGKATVGEDPPATGEAR
jgi:CBS domain containing-hemolysin-like protein